MPLEALRVKLPRRFQMQHGFADFAEFLEEIPQVIMRSDMIGLQLESAAKRCLGFLEFSVAAQSQAHIAVCLRIIGTLRNACW